MEPASASPVSIPTQEIQVLTASFAAEYGSAAGGQIRIVTKSGGTDFHGALYEYFRNSAMNAKHLDA